MTAAPVTDAPAEPDLTRLAVKANAAYQAAERAHQAGKRAARAQLEHARSGGEALLEAKALLAHGEFMPWVKANCDFSQRTANLYMAIAEHWQRVANCRSLRKAMVRLAGREAHDDAQPGRLEGRSVMVPIASLKPHPRNYKTHGPEQLDHLAASLEKHGCYQPVVVARDDTILAGTGRWLAAQQLGWPHVPVVKLPLDPNEPEALKLLVADNEVGKTADVDDRKLTDTLKEIAPSAGLVGTGYDPMMLASLVQVTRPWEEIRDFDAAAHWAGLPDYEQGRIVQRLTINFETVEVRDAFVKEHGIEIAARRSPTHLSAWWPPRKRDDRVNLTWAEGKEGA